MAIGIRLPCKYCVLCPHANGVCEVVISLAALTLTLDDVARRDWSVERGDGLGLRI